MSTPKIEQVRRQVAELQDQAEQATENANELGDDLTVITARLAGLQRDLVRQAAVVEQLRSRVGQFAAASYRSDGMDTTVQLLTADEPDDFLARMSTSASLTDQQSAAITALRAQQKVLADKHAAIGAEQARLTEARRQAEAQRTEANTRLTQSRDLLSRLTTAENARLAATERERERRAAAAARAAEAARAAAAARVARTAALATAQAGAERPAAAARADRDTEPAASTPKVGKKQVQRNEKPKGHQRSQASSSSGSGDGPHDPPWATCRTRAPSARDRPDADHSRHSADHPEALC